MHLGHQALIKHLQTQAKQRQLPSLVIIFEPQPNEYFSHDTIPSRLMRLRGKLAAIANCGIDRVLCLRFNDAFAHITAQDFIREILVKRLGVHYIVVGDDFRFGYQRQGDIHLLEQLGKQYSFQAQCMDTLEINGQRVSSTRIRKALEQGDLATANCEYRRP